MLIFGYFHKSRLLYGLPAFIDQKSWINRINKVILKNIKKLLKLKEKYEYIFKEKLTMYDKIIKQILDTEDIPSSAYYKRYIINRIRRKRRI